MKIRIRETIVDKQVQWVLIYMEGKSVNIWKENILENLETEVLEFKTVGEFLKEIKKKFGVGNKESVKVVELKEVE